jgi:hypothetical protein
VVVVDKVRVVICGKLGSIAMKREKFECCEKVLWKR